MITKSSLIESAFNRFATEVIHNWDRSSALLFQRIVSNRLTIGLSVSGPMGEGVEVSGPASQRLTLSVKGILHSYSFKDIIIENKKDLDLTRSLRVLNYFKSF